MLQKRKLLHLYVVFQGGRGGGKAPVFGPGGRRGEKKGQSFPPRSKGEGGVSTN